MPTQKEKHVIQSHLKEYASEVGFSVLCARSYGSRSKGLESQWSDYDVFFVYIEEPESYATGTDTDTYSRTVLAEHNELDTEIELHGWSLKKFIGSNGLCGSNPTAIEFAATDTEYYRPDSTIGNLFRSMLNYSTRQFKPYALIQHYRSLAASNYGKYIEDGYKLADGVSYNELLDLINPDYKYIAESAVERCQIDEISTQVDVDRVVVGGESRVTFNETVSIDCAIDEGLVEPTTTDITTKRYMNVVDALLRAKSIEYFKNMPPMKSVKLHEQISEYGITSETIQDEYADLMADKIDDHLREGERRPEIDSWIESELERDVEPDGLVDRQPDRGVIIGDSKTIYKKAREGFNNGLI